MSRFSFTARYFLSLLLVILTLTCSENSTEMEQVPLSLPPESTFLIDFSAFPERGGQPLPKTGELFLQTHENWGWAATNVLVWNTILFVNLAIPVAAFQASFSQDPVQQPDGSWVWAYTFPVGPDTFSAELHGSLSGEGTHWDMYISKNDSYNHFLWYTGGADLAFTQGSWTIYKHPSEPVAYLGIEWHRSISDSTADIKYTQLAVGDQPGGSYIHYGLTLDFPYNAYYDIFKQNVNNHVDIEWSRETKEGRVMDAQHFGDDVWHCWNENLDDIVCTD